MGYLKENHRNPSKYDLNVRRIYIWINHQRKVMNSGRMKSDRVEMFEKLQEIKVYLTEISSSSFVNLVNGNYHTIIDQIVDKINIRIKR